MKNVLKVLLVVVSILLVNCSYAQGDAEEAAKNVIKAYKTKDAVLLKKYMTGIMVYAINDGFFEGSDGKPLVEIAENWNGEIKEIRYSEGDIMGKQVLLASAYFSDNPNGNLNVVILSSYEKSDWKAFAFGITEINKEEFEKGSKEISAENKTEQKESDHSDYSIELANGDKFEKPTTDKMIELLKTLDDDNFYLILNSKDGYLQTSTSDKGYIVQYSDSDGMFEAEAYFTMDMLINIFTAYIDNGNWKEKAKWLEM